MINTNLTLKTTYECYQGLINSLKEKDFNKFKSITLNQNKNLSQKMKQALKLYKKILNILKIHLNMTLIMELLKELII